MLKLHSLFQKNKKKKLSCNNMPYIFTHPNYLPSFVLFFSYFVYSC